MEWRSLAGKRAPADGRENIELENSRQVRQDSPRIWILQKNTARLWVLFISDTMPSFWELVRVCYSRHPFRCFIILPWSTFLHFKTPTDYVAMKKMNVVYACLYRLCRWKAFIPTSTSYSTPQLTHKHLCHLGLSSVCLPLSSHFPPPTSPRVPAVSSL